METDSVRDSKIAAMQKTPWLADAKQDGGREQKEPAHIRNNTNKKQTTSNRIRFPATPRQAELILLKHQFLHALPCACGMPTLNQTHLFAQRCANLEACC